MPYSLLDGIPFYTKEEIDENFSDGSVAEERARAEAAEALLQGNIDTVNDRVDGISERLDTAEDTIEEVSVELPRETSRATAAEQANATAIQTETMRAGAAEQANTDALQAEVTRATTAEGNLSNAVIRETTRATTAETTLQGNIDAEETRAEAAEGALQDAIDAVDDKADANAADIAQLQTDVGTNASNIAGISAKIPAEASSQNQLADKAYVADQIETNAATYRGSFATWADVPTDPNDYLADPQANKKPEPHDYIYVRDASGYNVQNTGTWKFEYSGDWDAVGKNGWTPVYSVNADVFNQAQMAAIDSGVTATKVGNYDTHIANTQNPHSVTKAQVGLGNCDNTSDADKPISTATQTALNAKQDTLIAGNGVSIVNNVISAGAAAALIPISASGSTISVENGSKRYILINDGIATRSATVAASLTLTDVTSEAFVIADPTNTEKWTLTYLDKTGLASKTIDVLAGEYVRFIWNGAGFICEHTIPFTGIDENNVSFSYDVIVRD